MCTAVSLRETAGLRHRTLEIAVRFQPTAFLSEACYNKGMDIGQASRHARLALLAAENGRHEEAIRHYRDALSLQPHSAALRYNLGLELSAAGRNGEALAELKKAAELDPKDADALNECGRIEIAENRLSSAAGFLEEALQRNPEHSGALNNRGVVDFLKGRYADAVRRFRAAAESSPSLADAWYNLADALDECGDTDAAAEARRHFEELNS